MASTLSFNVEAFRALYPAFAATPPTDATLQAYWDAATCYISNKNCGSLRGNCRQQALNLMTAHLAALSVIIAAGQTPGQVQSSTIDKISVTLTPPVQDNQWQWWLGTTPYGQQLLALLQVRSAGGFFFGGRFEPLAIRRIGS